jgi:hypothetical protein
MTSSDDEDVPGDDIHGDDVLGATGVLEDQEEEQLDEESYKALK